MPKIDPFRELRFGAKLRRFRKAKGWPACELAERAGISNSGISLYENFQRRPNKEPLERIAKALGVSLEMLKDDVGAGAIAHGEVRVGQGTVIADYVVLDGRAAPVTVGEDCLIGSHAYLASRVDKPVVVSAGCKIGAHAVLLGPVELPLHREVPAGKILAPDGVS